MMKVYILPKALFRLDEIYNYLCVFSESIAAEIYNRILDEIAKLELFPELGFVETMLEDSEKVFRSLIIMKHYKVIYYIEKEDHVIYIATIWDCRQNPDNMKSIVI